MGCGSGSGIRRLFDPGTVSGMGKKSGSGSGMNIQDYISESLETIFLGVKILKFFDVDPGSGMEKIRIRDPGWKNFGSGMEKIWIWDPG
jgi:hypothetical protein